MELSRVKSASTSSAPSVDRDRDRDFEAKPWQGLIAIKLNTSRVITNYDVLVK